MIKTLNEWCLKYVESRLIREEDNVFFDKCDYCEKEKVRICFIAYHFPILEKKPTLFGMCCTQFVQNQLDRADTINSQIADTTRMPVRSKNISDVLTRLVKEGRT